VIYNYLQDTAYQTRLPKLQKQNGKFISQNFPVITGDQAAIFFFFSFEPCLDPWPDASISESCHFLGLHCVKW
jgi:hypothetical protein